ncbi:MAG: hypothetical protein WA729_18970, partial [Pseudolabrys sp.]
EQNHALSMVTFSRAAGVCSYAPRHVGPQTRRPRSPCCPFGLLPGHANAVAGIYRAQGLLLERRITLEGWVTMVMRRPSSSR